MRGGVLFFDGQFDDARLLINLVTTAFEQGAALLHYTPVEALTKDAQGCVNGVVAVDAETGAEFRAAAKVVVNATGAFTDNLRRLAYASAAPLIAASQGIHLVFDRGFLPGATAIMVPHTSDGRVMFAIPWHGHTLVGTTDTPIAHPALEPAAMEQEVDFLLSTASRVPGHKADEGGRAQCVCGYSAVGTRARWGEYGALARDHVSTSIPRV